NTANPAPLPKKPATGSSKTGAVLSILALIVVSIGAALIHWKYQPEQAATSTAEKAGEAVASGTWSVLTALFGMPLLVLGIGLALLAICMTVIRLRKARGGGLVFSLVWLFLAGWAIKLAADAFSLISAN